MDNTQIVRDQNKINPFQPQPEINDSKSSHNELSSDDNKSINTNNSSEWNCKMCTFENKHSGNLCAMCDESRCGYETIHENAWNTVLSLNTNNETELPQWIKCKQCNLWRVIQVSTSTIRTWKPSSSYTCAGSNGEFICGTQSANPSIQSYSHYELFVLGIQRCFAYLETKGVNAAHVTALETQIKDYTQADKKRKLQNSLKKADTIIIDDSNESENVNNEREKPSSPSGWICSMCTFKNEHLGNLCAMCDTAKPGSTVTKMSDEQYAKLLHNSFEQGRDTSITPEINRIAISNNNIPESSPDLTTSSEQKRAMSIDSNSNNNNINNNNNANLINQLPTNAEIGPFGVITCVNVNSGRRVYLMRNQLNPMKLTWELTPPKLPQSWVRDRFGAIIDKLPKMNKTQRQQIEQLNEQGHYFDSPINIDAMTFSDDNDNKIDLTATDNSENDIEIITEKKDHEYAKKLQALFDDESKVPESRVKVPIRNGYVDFEAMNENRNNAIKKKNDEDVMDFDFNYDGMHAKDISPVFIGQDNRIGIRNEDNSEQSVAQMLNMALRQENMQPIGDVNGMVITLFDHQKKGVAWMLQMEADRKCKGGFLCDQMGVGKTIQIIALMIKSKESMMEEAKKKYKQDGYVSESDYEDSVDSQDDTCGGFVVEDDVIDFRSDDDMPINNNHNTNNVNDNNNKVDDDDWFPGMEASPDNDENNGNGDWFPGMNYDEEDNTDNKKKEQSEESSLGNRPLRKRGKKRKFSEVDDCDSERTLDEEEIDEVKCLNDLSNSNSNVRADSLGSDSPFVLRDEDDIEDDIETSPDLVGGLLNRMKNKNNKKKKKKLSDYYGSEPSNKRRKLNNGNRRKKKKKCKKKKKNNGTGNAVYDAWLIENGFSAKKKQKSKPWLGLKQRTLIVGPLAILDQWAEEIKDKAPNQFKICIYHGAGRKKKYDKYSLKKYDVVITTFGHVTSEYAKGNEEKQYGLFKLRSGFFHRVVLDEAHTIKNPSSQQSKACACIGNRGVKVRWCLTGTPIQNKLLDLFPLCRFLQIKQCGTQKDFKQFLKLGSGKNVSVAGRSKQLVTSFLAAHMLRRLKDEVVDDLVSKTEEVIELEFDDAENHVYKAFQNHARSRFNKFVQAGTAKKNYAHILVLLLRLRQICDHPFLAMKIQDGRSESVGDRDGSESDGNVDDSKDPLEKIDKKVIKRLNERESILDSECPICLDIFNDGIMFPGCGHLICKEHLYDLEEKCPECRGGFRVNRVISFRIIIKSALIDEKHKRSLLANDGKDGLIMDGNIVAEQMGNVSSEKRQLKAANRKIVWRKVGAAKGIFRSAEQMAEEEEKKDENEDVKEKLKRMQEKFEWNTYVVDEKFVPEFNDDDETGYEDCDKYPNEEYGWKFIPSSKTKMMMQKIQSIRKNKPNDKIIVFSQFTTMLSVLERVLRKHQINYLIYDGSKTRKERKDIINSFKKDEYNDIPVILMSLKCAALGLNLTVANHVIFCDLWWNPAIECQAIDRVHRIGQEKHVFITRMVIKGSAEERILALQREKKKIADSTLDGANFAKKHGLSVQDLAMLFGSDENIMRMARANDTGFSRDALMNVRRRPNNNNNHNINNHNDHNINNHNINNNNRNFMNNNMHNHNHNHNHNNNHMMNNNYNHGMLSQDQYFRSLDAQTQALIAQLQNE